MATLTIGSRARTSKARTGKARTVSPASVRRIKRRVVRIRQAHVEAALFLLVAAALVVLIGSRVERWLVTPATAPTVQVTVQKGDTLWGLASEYGDRDQYILERVDDLARRNRIRPGQSIQPGDVLKVPVGVAESRARVAAR